MPRDDQYCSSAPSARPSMAPCVAKVQSAVSMGYARVDKGPHRVALLRHEVHHPTRHDDDLEDLLAFEQLGDAGIVAGGLF